MTLDDACLDGLRHVGDPEADQLAADLLKRHPGLDEGDLVRLVLDELAGRSGDEFVREWLFDPDALPRWANPGLLRKGQGFFADWPLPIATSLFCVSLPAAYAAADGAQVLAVTSDLATHNLHRRIAETGRMLFDVMDFGTASSEALRPGSQGYLTIRGVRLLHAVVRQTLLSEDYLAQNEGEGIPERWNPDWGLPVNQEDLLGTLFSFTVAVFEGLDRLGIPYDPRSADAYFHTWCVIGHLLGIREDLLPLNRQQASELTDAIAERHHHSSAAGKRLMSVLLETMETSMPLGLHKLPRTLIRHQLPADVAEMLDVPPAAWWHPAVEVLSTVGPRLRHFPGGVRLVQAPSALLGRLVLRRLVDAELHGSQPAFRIDPVVREKLAIDTSPLRRTLRRRRHRIRCATTAAPADRQ
jgi:hypothetical protein